MRRFLKENGLSVAFGVLFLSTLVAQAFVGHADFNHQQAQHANETVSLLRYVTSSAFGVDVLENWQSEYLQFSLFIFATVWLLQRGSPESKVMHKAGSETDEEQQLGAHVEEDSPPWARAGGARTWLFSNSLLIVMTAIWVLSWLGQSITGRIAYNAEQLDHHEAPLSWVDYLGSSDFWNRTLQNWQSEFLAVGSMVVLSIYLRQRGSSQSKPVGAGHQATGVEG